MGFTPGVPPLLRRLEKDLRILQQFNPVLLINYSVVYYSTGIMSHHDLLVLVANRNDYILIERNPPPRGGFLFTMFPDQDPGGRGPPVKNHT